MKHEFLLVIMSTAQSFFAVESLSFMESKRVLFLNSFLKKGTKQYKGEIETARRILNKYI